MARGMNNTLLASTTMALFLVAAAAALVAGATGVEATAATRQQMADAARRRSVEPSAQWATPTQAETYSNNDNDNLISKDQPHTATRPPTEQLRVAARKGWQVLWWTGVVSAATTLATTAAFVALTVLSTFAKEERGAENRAAWMRAVRDTRDFYRGFYYFWRLPTARLDAAAYRACPVFGGAGSRQAKVQVFSLALIFHMWDRPHYRSGTFQHDMAKNLRNVALPGTGVPLSALCGHRLVALWFVVVAYPLVALAAAVWRVNGNHVLREEEDRRHRRRMRAGSKDADAGGDAGGADSDGPMRGPMRGPPRKASKGADVGAGLGVVVPPRGAGGGSGVGPGTVGAGAGGGEPASDSDESEPPSPTKVTAPGSHRYIAAQQIYTHMEPKSTFEVVTSVMGARVAAAYREQLLFPQDWFSFWRLNCRLATFHAWRVPGEDGYALEDKWRFLERARETGVAVTPVLKLPELICKHRNEEGGLGFAKYVNADVGGDWIIQQALHNDAFFAALLPGDAPLSTLRIVTASRAGLPGQGQGNGVTALSCVWRAGRAGALTDHSSVLFDVDLRSGALKRGTTNAHWYELGPRAATRTPWLSAHRDTAHPDTGTRITGARVPDMVAVRAFAEDAHAKLCPGVPLVGWDVALTKECGMVMLEGNFSCNFFRGHFDQEAYFKFYEDYAVHLLNLPKQGNAGNGKAKAE